MNMEFALHLSDTRLLQTVRLLELALGEHPDQESVEQALGAIHVCRERLTALAAPQALRKCAG